MSLILGCLLYLRARKILLLLFFLHLRLYYTSNTYCFHRSLTMTCIIYYKSSSIIMCGHLWLCPRVTCTLSYHIFPFSYSSLFYSLLQETTGLFNTRKYFKFKKCILHKKRVAIKNLSSNFCWLGIM